MPKLNEVLDLDKVGKESLVRLDVKPSNLLPRSTLTETSRAIKILSNSVYPTLQVQKQLANTILASQAPIQQLAKSIPSLNLQPAIANLVEAMPKTEELLKALQPTLKISDAFSSAIENISKPIKGFVEKIRLFAQPPPFVKIINDFGKQFSRLAASILDSFKRSFEPFLRLLRSNFFLIVAASKGEELALHHLGKLWWKLWVIYKRTERQKGSEPSKEEFKRLVQEACWEVLKEREEKPTSLLKIARLAYYAVLGLIFVDAVLVTDERLTGSMELQILKGNYKSSIRLYHDENNKPHLFVKTVSQELGVSPQTIRNWIKSGQITSIKISYFSKLKQVLVPAYLIPYETSTINDLRQLKNLQERRKLHQIEGYFTRSQLTKEYSISTKTLERWGNEGKLVPKRINGIRYYSENQVRQVPLILKENQSPKIKGLMARYNPSY